MPWVAIKFTTWKSQDTSLVKIGWSSTWLTAGATARATDQVLEMAFAEVGDANRASRPSTSIYTIAVVHGDRAVEVGGGGMVEQEEVDVVEAEAAQAALEPDDRLS